MRKFGLIMIGMLFLCVQLLAQTHLVSGRIMDQKSNPVPNASVTVKGTLLGTTTNNNGEFSLTVPNSATTLVVSSVSFAAKEVAITSGPVDVTLQSGTSNLQEVVVVAYGTQKKSNVTGSVATVKPQQIENKPFTSVDKALQGAVAGLQSSSASGAPGSSTSIRIRGFGSINASANPLWVIDGVIATTGDLTSNTTTANILSSLNPDDIESISVLKDAAASSIYGSRAANGVILVTTKKGKGGKTSLTFSTEIGQNDRSFKPSNKSLTTAQNQEILRDAVINAGFVNNAADADALIVDPVNGFGLKPDVNTNWLDQVTRKGNQSQYNISLSGGSDKTQFYASGGFFKQDGTTIATDFKRYNGSISITHKATDRINFSTSLSGSSSIQNTPTNGGTFANPVLASFFLLPWYSPYNTDGTVKYNDADGFFTNNSGIFNPLAIAKLNKAQNNQTTFRGYVSGDARILDNLKFTSRFSAEYFDIQEDQYRNPVYGDGFAQGGDAFASYLKVFNYTFSNYFDYRQNLNAAKDIYFNLKVGYEAQHYKQYQLQAGGQTLPQVLSLQYLATASTPTTAFSLPSENATQSYFTTGDINYKDRYVLSGSFRRDGSSVFGPDKRYGNFYSVGGTWNINEEEFFQNLGVINLLKLRGSYGENGNSIGFGNYSALSLYSFGANYTGLPGSVGGNIGNPGLTWEKNKISNIALDFGLFRDRLYGSVEVYNRKTSGLLANVPLAPSEGFTSQLTNIGAITNKGVEVTIGGRPVVSKDFNWSITANFAHNVNRVNELYGGRPIPASQFQYTVGHDAQEYYLRQWAGVDPANGDPLWYTDGTHSKTTNAIAQAALSLSSRSAAPKYFGSVTNNFNYKGISLEAQFFYNFGNYVYDSWGSYLNSDGLYLGSFNQYNQQLTRWQKAGDVTNVPKIIYGGNKNSYRASTRYLYKGDYIRLRDIQLGYTLPKDISSKAHLANVNIYVRGTNLFLFGQDKNLPFDPETGVNSTANLEVFIPKTITAGIKIGL